MGLVFSQGRKSWHSNPDGNCVEVGVLEYSDGGENTWAEAGTFRQSARCDKDCCVQVGTGPGVVGFRDTKQLNRATGVYEGLTLEVPVPAYRAFLGKIRRSGPAGTSYA